MKKGVKARFHDAQEMLKFNPDVYEFHFSDKDMSFDFKDQKYTQELVVHGPEYWGRKLLDPAGEFGSSLTHTREKTVEVIQIALDKTRQISKNFQGKPMFVLHPGGMSLYAKPDTDELYNNLILTMKELQPGNVEILLENMPPFPWFFGGQWFCNIFKDADEIKQFLNNLGLRSMCFDLCHAQLYCNQANKDIIEYIKKLNPYIKHVHISDADGIDGEGLQINEGKVDFVKTLNVLRKDISMIPEIWQGHLDNGKGFKTAFERLKKYGV